jgi:hypothetical protein
VACSPRRRAPAAWPRPRPVLQGLRIERSLVLERAHLWPNRVPGVIADLEVWHVRLFEAAISHFLYVPPTACRSMYESALTPSPPRSTHAAYRSEYRVQLRSRRPFAAVAECNARFRHLVDRAARAIKAHPSPLALLRTPRVRCARCAGQCSVLSRFGNTCSLHRRSGRKTECPVWL